MPAFAPIALTSPIPAVTMTPVRIKGDVAFYEDQSQPIAELRKTLSISLTSPSKTSKLYKMRCRVVMPVADAVTGSYSHSLTFDCTTLMPKEATEASRAALFELLFAVINDSAEFSAAIVEQQTIY